MITAVKNKEKQFVPKDQYDALLEKNDVLLEKNEILQRQLSELQRMLFGVKSERFVPASDGQIDLFTGRSKKRRRTKARD
ncbi:MAG: IS66 family transposase [Polaribacter sp.]